MRTSKRTWVRILLTLRQNRSPILFVITWLSVNFVVFVRYFAMSSTEALRVATCVTKLSSGYASLYQSFTEVVVFGTVASVIFHNVTRRYRPEQTCLALAEQSQDHVVIIGFTNLGRRVWELLHSGPCVAVVVEESPSLASPVIALEAPLVLGCAQERATLVSAGVARARVVVIATDDFETVAVACRLVRELNPGCELVVRCADDDVGITLARTYRARMLSTSKLAAAFVVAHARKVKSRSAVVFGDNNVGSRTADALRREQLSVRHTGVTEDQDELSAAGVVEADLIVLCDDDLGRNLVRVDRIRDLNKHAQIVCRAYHEAAAEVLKHPPFQCLVFSTSRHAVETLVHCGAFRSVGVSKIP